MSITFDQQWAVRNSKEILKYQIIKFNNNDMEQKYS